MKLPIATLLLGTTMLSVPFVSQAGAQQQFTGPCAELQRLVDQDGDRLRQEFADVDEVIRENAANKCIVYVRQIQADAGGSAASGSRASDRATSDTQAQRQQREQVRDSAATRETRSFTARENLQQSIEIDRQAIIEGDVVVRVPNPEVNIDQPGAEVRVEEQPATVTIDQKKPQVVVRQKPANIRVSVPRPVVTIEQPAPEIIITMPPPGVSIDQSQPQVNVVMADPKVSVRQEDPKLDIDVQTRLVQGDSGSAAQEPRITTRTERTDAEGNSSVARADSNVSVSKGKATVRMSSAQGQANYKFNRAQPDVRYEPAKPNIEVVFADEPRVRVQQTGEPTVRFNRQNAQQQERQTSGSGASGSGAAGSGASDRGASSGPDSASAGSDANQRQQATAGTSQRQQARVDAAQRQADMRNMLGANRYAAQLPTTVVTTLPVNIIGRDVVTRSGEEVGDVDRVVRNNGQVYVIVEHGGFLGIGDKEIALPLRRVAMWNDEVLLLGLTEEEFEAMPDYDFESDQTLDRNFRLDMNRYDG